MLRYGKRTERTALRKRVRVLIALSLCWTGSMGYKLFSLQFLRSEQLQTSARAQQQQVITLDARRGLLYDRNGRELARSIEVDSLYGVPAQIEDPARTAAALAPALGIDRAAIPALAEKLTGDKLFVWARRKISPKTRSDIEALSITGIGFVKEHKRFYPHGRLAAHVLGWVGMDNKGMDGIELALDERLGGTNGQFFALRDARRALFLKETRREPTPGNSVVLSIDQTIQHFAERELSRAIAETGSRAGSVIVMHPDTGDVLAMASEPTYSPNTASLFPEESRKNRAVVDAYEPGSTFKLITIAAALERGLVDPSELFDCQNGSIRVGRSLIRDHKRFGILTASQILERSSNVGAIKIGLRLNPFDFHATIDHFGFGRKTGIALPGEARGLVREPGSWSGLSQASLSFGQEMALTPVQLVTAVNAVATGGLLRPPRLVLREVAPDGSIVSETLPGPERRVADESTMRTLTRMMTGVIEEGTATSAQIPGYSIAGKTGTAQKIGEDGRYSQDRFVASFVGFVPASRPALTILVVLDEPRGRLYHGGDIAAPVFQRIAMPSLRYLNVPPENDSIGLPEQGDEGMTLKASERTRLWSAPVDS